MALLCYFPEVNDNIEFKGWNYRTTSSEIALYKIEDVNSTHVKFDNKFISIAVFIRDYKWYNDKGVWRKNAY